MAMHEFSAEWWKNGELIDGKQLRTENADILLFLFFSSYAVHVRALRARAHTQLIYLRIIEEKMIILL